jgi:hypothetical protein
LETFTLFLCFSPEFEKAVLFLKFETGSSPGFTMSYNQIIRKKVLGAITKNGKQTTLSAATQTSNWTRPEFAVDGLKDDFRESRQ